MTTVVPPAEEITGWGRIRRHLGAARGPFSLITVLSVISAQLEAVALLLVVPTAQAVTEGDTQTQGSIGPIDLQLSPGRAAAYAAIALVLAAVTNVATARVRSVMASQWERKERDRLFLAFMSADWEIQSSQRAGHLNLLASYSAKSMQLLEALVGFVRSSMTILIFVGLAILIDWRAALVISVGGLGLFLSLRPVVRRMRDVNRQTSRLHLRYSAELTEFAALARDVRVFRAWPGVDDRLGSLSGLIEEQRRRSSFLSGAVAPAYQYVGLLLLVLILAVAGSTDGVDVAALAGTGILLLRGLQYGGQLQNCYQQIIDCTPFLERIEEAEELYASHRTVDGDEELPPPSVITFEGVAYSYPEVADDDPQIGDVETEEEHPSEVALVGVDLELRVGEVVGLVGPSGSGKSTLAQVLLRLRQPTEGRLLADGRPADLFSLDSWYRSVAFVPQDPRLFRATVADNISFLEESYDRAAIEDAARRAGLDTAIRALPDGYDTPIGPGFRDLSGGQIQRIGIARALLRGARVLVLDEPTSALDMESEAIISDTIAALRGETLVVVIAHRLSTLDVCDHLVVLERGRVSATGTPREVGERNAFFRRALELGSLDGLVDVGPSRSARPGVA